MRGLDTNIYVVYPDEILKFSVSFQKHIIRLENILLINAILNYSVPKTQKET